ncbi:unnamed protein product [Clonostachys solani]|uniref:Uncharacterized protein n=1 Tax=Clonostachys solani TaxID=160281 RepID=A0A9N9ZI75_9HYPO|nr:unnamed protein product [Clonostachys solani]
MDLAAITLLVYHAPPYLIGLVQLRNAGHAHDADAHPSRAPDAALPLVRDGRRAELGAYPGPVVHRPPDGHLLEVLPLRLGDLRQTITCAAELRRRRETHAEHAGVGDDVDAGVGEALEELGVAEAGVLDAEVAVGLDGVDGLAGLPVDHLGEGGEHVDGVAADADVAEDAILVAQPAELCDGGEDLARGDELGVVGVDEVEVGGAQAVQAAVDGGADGDGRVVKGLGVDAAGLCEEEVGGARGLDGLEGVAEEVLGGAVVGGRVEGSDAVGEQGLADDGDVGHVRGIGVVLRVEGGRAEDQRRQDRRQRRWRRRNGRSHVDVICPYFLLSWCCRGGREQGCDAAIWDWVPETDQHRQSITTTGGPALEGLTLRWMDVGVGEAKSTSTRKWWGGGSWRI